MTDDRPPQYEGVPPGAGPTDNGASEPPPLTAFAWRSGLVRPVQGRLIAGVSGAIARATNTDPVLWRVLIAVLTIFGGLGVLVYVLGWLLLPADGDTAAPVEALLGRGRSATSTALTVIIGLVALIAVGAFVSEPFQPGIVGAILLGAAALLLLRDQRGRGRATGPAPSGAAASGAAPSGAVPSAPGMPGGMTAPMASTGTPADTTASYPAAAYPGAASTVPGPPPVAPPLAPPVAPPPSPPYAPGPYSQGSYPQPPFAPRGPFAPGGLPPQPPPPRPHLSHGNPHPRRPKRPPSRLRRFTLSLLLIVIGAMIAVDFGYGNIPPVAYLAAALGVVAIGLIIGAWFGRARGLIAVGIVLSIALTSVAGLSHLDGSLLRPGTITYTPASLSQLQRDYNQSWGEVRLDLTKLDFTDSTEPVAVDINASGGKVLVTLPSTVDVTVDTNVDVGEARVLGQTWSGVGLDARTVTDDGSDGKGGGTLIITAHLSAGSLEVTR